MTQYDFRDLSSKCEVRCRWCRKIENVYVMTNDYLRLHILNPNNIGNEIPYLTENEVVLWRDRICSKCYESLWDGVKFEPQGYILSCLSCGRGLCDECPDNYLDDRDNCCCGGRIQTTLGSNGFRRSNVESNSGDGRSRKGRNKKADESLEDPLSTWRKRASLAYPLDPEADCEWKGLADCGGGKYPIVGCANGKQKTLHHGPVKIDNTTRYDFNTRTEDIRNIHLICTRCHALWHYWNDTPYTPESYMEMPHKPRVATPRELIQWSSAKTRPTAPEPRMTPIKSKESD